MQAWMGKEWDIIACAHKYHIRNACVVYISHQYENEKNCGETLSSTIKNGKKKTKIYILYLFLKY